MKKLLTAICILLGVLMLSGCGETGKTDGAKPAADVSVPGDFTATTFRIAGKEFMVYENFFPADERARYGLRNYSSAITEADLGEQMGTVMDCSDASLNGCTVYHYAKYPTYDTICIVDTPDGYRFFNCEWLAIPEEVLQSSDAALSAYGLPDSAEVIEVYSVSSDLLLSIENDDAIRDIFEILSGKADIGMNEHNRLMEQAWKDACSVGGMDYSDAELWEIEESRQAVWAEGRRVIQFATENGFCQHIGFIPVVGSFSLGNGHYVLTEDEVVRLTELLSPAVSESSPSPESAYLYYSYGGENPKRYDLSEEELSVLWAQYSALEFAEGEAPDGGEAWNVCFVFGTDSLYFSMDETGRSTEGQCDAPEAFLECVKSLYLGRRDLQKSPEDIDAAIACVQELLPTAEIWYEPSASTEAAEDYIHTGGGAGRELAHEDVVAVFSRENANGTEVTRKNILVRAGAGEPWELADFGLHLAELDMDYDLAARFG